MPAEYNDDLASFFAPKISQEEQEKRTAEVASAATRLGIEPNRIANYARALWKWTKAGFPTRTDEEVKAIHAQHCEPCEQYVEGRCKKCGCRAVEKGMALTNKIKMATEACLEKKW